MNKPNKKYSDYSIANKLRIAQNSFNGEQWMFESPKRNHFKNKCGSHSFCGVEYDLKPAYSSDFKKI